MKTPPLILTAGEPAGIGPDIVLSLLSQSRWHELQCPIVVIADKPLLQTRAKLLDLSFQAVDYTPGMPLEVLPSGSCYVWHVPLKKPCQCGQLNIENADYVVTTLKLAALACQQQQFAAMVTAPVHKEIIHRAGIPFTGHTGFLGEMAGVAKTVMLFVSQQLSVALLTTHIPLAKVPQAITIDNIQQTIRLLAAELTQLWQIKNPRILVCGLNPHAGEDGLLGQEEKEIIIPALEQLRQQGYQLLGPLPADTAFMPKHHDGVDVILAMYHDQGLCPLKSQGFGQAVNVTLGLPYIRTSVDHGTALKLAGTGKANADSLFEALYLARELTSTEI